MSYIQTSWRAGMQTASAKIDDTFGEPLRITPCEMKPNFPGCAVPKQAFEVLGVFSWRAHIALANGHDRMHGNGGLVQTQKPVVSFSRDALKWMLQRGDQITRLCDSTKWEVTAVQSDGVSRITCELVQLGVAAL